MPYTWSILINFMHCEPSLCTNPRDIPCSANVFTVGKLFNKILLKPKWYCLDMGSTDRYCVDNAYDCRDKVQTTTAHFQPVRHIYSSCQVSTSSLQLMSCLYRIFTAHVQRVLHLYSTNTDSTLFLQHLYYPHPVSSPSLLSMSIQYTISPANMCQNPSSLQLLHQS